MLAETHTIDFETYYSPEYSLSKMQTDAYIYDPRFEIILVGVDGAWFSGTLEETKDWIYSVTNPAIDTFVAHHAAFDGFILSERLGIKPKKWIDTLSMARAVHPELKSHSLASLAKFFQLPDKKGYVTNAINKRRADFSRQELEAYADYCLHDVWLTQQIHRELDPLLPNSERAIIDMTIRMFTEPRLALDADILNACYKDEIQRKEELMQKASIDKSILMSNEKFAQALWGLGVEPPMKTSARTGKPTYAFAKSDKAFTALLDHVNPDVQALVAARLGVKSTIAETRALRMYETATRGRGLFPVMLNYWGAKTTGRHSGGNGINPQNFPARARGSEIRKAMVAPPGHKVVVGDSSNIELRVAMACAGQTDALDMLRRGVDLYCAFASKLFGREILDIPEHKAERTLGKVAMLSLQYGAGWSKFKEIVRLMAKMDITDEEAQRIVNLYREVHGSIKRLWHYGDSTVIPAIFNRELFVPVDVNGWFVTVDDGFCRPGLPGVVYKDLIQSVADSSWSYGDPPQLLHGGKLVENLCQHAARHIVMWQTAVVHAMFPVALSVHDEIVCVVADEEVEACVKLMEKVLSVPPPWCAETLPVAGKVAYGESYGEAK